MPDEVVALLLVSLFWMRTSALALHRRTEAMSAPQSGPRTAFTVQRCLRASCSAGRDRFCQAPGSSPHRQPQRPQTPAPNRTAAQLPSLHWKTAPCAGSAHFSALSFLQLSWWFLKWLK